MMEIPQIKIVTCKTKVEVFYGPLLVDEVGEVEAGENHCYKYAKQMTILPEDPVPLHVDEALEKPDLVENNPITRFHETLNYNMVSLVKSYNQKQEALVLAIKNPGIHTINLKYIR